MSGILKPGAPAYIVADVVRLRKALGSDLIIDDGRVFLAVDADPELAQSMRDVLSFARATGLLRVLAS